MLTRSRKRNGDEISQTENEVPVLLNTRSKKAKVDDGTPKPSPKPRKETIGEHLKRERKRETKEVIGKPLIQEYEAFQTYEKETVLQSFQGSSKVEKFQDQLYETSEDHGKVKLVFLTLQTGSNPETFSHLCNNSSLVWNLRDLNLKTGEFHFSLPSVAMVFVRGEFIPGTSLESTSYLYLGVIGLHSVMSSNCNYLEARFVFDEVLTRYAINEYFGANCLRCKKNKYGVAICGWK
eukprot:gene505-538_t